MNESQRIELIRTRMYNLENMLSARARDLSIEYTKRVSAEEVNAALRAALAELIEAVNEGDPQTVGDVVGQVKGLVE